MPRSVHMNRDLWMSVALAATVLLASRAVAVETVCHRGANEYAPENTRAAAQLCVDWGVDYVEVDVRTSKDGVMYIIHDAMVDRTTNGTGHVVSLASHEIDALDAGSWFDPKFKGERIPRLEPFLRWIKGKTKVYLDVKGADPEKLVKLIYDLGFKDDCFLWSSNPIIMRGFCEHAPELPLKVNVKTPKEVEAAKRDYNARIVEFRVNDITPQLLETCRRLGIRTMVVDLGNDPRAYRKVIESGIDMINLDHADLFMEVQEQVRQDAKP